MKQRHIILLGLSVALIPAYVSAQDNVEIDMSVIESYEEPVNIPQIIEPAPDRVLFPGYQNERSLRRLDASKIKSRPAPLTRPVRIRPSKPDPTSPLSEDLLDNSIVASVEEVIRKEEPIQILEPAQRMDQELLLRSPETSARPSISGAPNIHYRTEGIYVPPKDGSPLSSENLLSHPSGNTPLSANGSVIQAEELTLKNKAVQEILSDLANREDKQNIPVPSSKPKTTAKQIVIAEPPIPPLLPVRKLSAGIEQASNPAEATPILEELTISQSDPVSVENLDVPETQSQDSTIVLLEQELDATDDAAETKEVAIDISAPLPQQDNQEILEALDITSNQDLSENTQVPKSSRQAEYDEPQTAASDLVVLDPTSPVPQPPMDALNAIQQDVPKPVEAVQEVVEMTEQDIFDQIESLVPDTNSEAEAERIIETEAPIEETQAIIEQVTDITAGNSYSQNAASTNIEEIISEDSLDYTRLIYKQGQDSLEGQEQMSILNNALTRLKSDRSLNLEIRSFASNADNTENSDRRVALARGIALRSYLVRGGINATRISLKSSGSNENDVNKDYVDLVFLSSE